jgi:hypothetical protein
MWGQLSRCTSCGAGFASAVDAVKRAAEFLHHGVERDFEGGAPSDQDIIVAGLEQSRRRKPNKLAQAAAHTVALDGIADLFADRETNAWRTALAARTGLQDEAAGMNARADLGSLGDGPKLTPPFQPLHCRDFEMTRLKDALAIDANRNAEPVALRHSVVCGHVRAARPKLCGRPCSPCERESHGGACVRACSADRSVSRGCLRCAADRGHKSPRLRRLIREGSRPVKSNLPLSYQPFPGILLQSCDSDLDRGRGRILAATSAVWRRLRAPDRLATTGAGACVIFQSRTAPMTYLMFR